MSKIWAAIQYIPHFVGLYFGKRLCDYLLRNTEKIAANSVRELFVLAFRRLWKKEKLVAKELFNLGNGALVLSEEGGTVTLSVSEKASLGGGEAAGVLSIEGEGKLILKGRLGFHLGMALLEAHSPGPLVAIEKAGEALADAALSKL